MQKPSAMVLAVALAATAGEANVSKDSFGTTAAGQPVDRYTLTKRPRHYGPASLPMVGSSPNSSCAIAPER